MRHFDINVIERRWVETIFRGCTDEYTIDFAKLVKVPHIEATAERSQSR